MTIITLEQIADQLREPFPPKLIKLLPRRPKQRDGKWYCMAWPYAEKRVYEDRLNGLAPGQWQTPPATALVAGDKLVVFATVIICGVAHTDVSEAFLANLSRTGEEGGTTATDLYELAFKRACSHFGLGRYFQQLRPILLPYNPDSKTIAIKDGERVAWMEKMYMDAGILLHDRVDPQMLSYLRRALNSEQAQRACTYYKVSDLAQLTAKQALHLSEYIEQQQQATPTAPAAAPEHS